MLRMIEGFTDERRAQTLMVSLVREAWPNKETRLVAWRPSSEEMRIHHNSEYWFGSREVGGDHGVHRHWNALGVHKAKGNLSISVEINIPISDNSGRISGFFARDPRSGKIYLMHDGGVGGGRKGIGRDSFLEAINARPVEVQMTTGTRSALIVAPLDDQNFEAGLSSFLEKVVAFKTSDSAGQPQPTPDGLPTGASIDDYFREYSGEKMGGGDRFTYQSRHGDVVHAMVGWVEEHGIPGKIQKSVLVDLAVLQHNTLTAVFEIKSATDRQSLYSGIGQLMVHSAQAHKVKRYLVIPQGAIPEDISSCLESLSIQVVRYEIDGRLVRFAS